MSIIHYTPRALSLCKWATWKKNVESWIFFWWFLGVQRVRKAEVPSSRPWALFKMAIFKMAATQHYKYPSKGIKSTLCYILFVKTSLTRAGKFMVVLKTRSDKFFKMADIQNGRHVLFAAFFILGGRLRSTLMHTPMAEPKWYEMKPNHVYNENPPGKSV